MGGGWIVSFHHSVFPEHGERGVDRECLDGGMIAAHRRRKEQRVVDRFLGGLDGGLDMGLIASLVGCGTELRRNTGTVLNAIT